MLEGVDRDWHETRFVDMLIGLETSKVLLEDIFLQPGDGLQERQRHLGPNDRCGLQERLFRGRADDRDERL